MSRRAQSREDGEAATWHSACLCCVLISGGLLAAWRTASSSQPSIVLQPPEAHLTPGPLSRRERRRRRRRERQKAALKSNHSVLATSASSAATSYNTSGPLPAHAALFDMAFFINADDSVRRREFMERQLTQAGVRYERWPAIRGGPQLLTTHAQYFRRGVEKHLYLNKTLGSGTIGGWGTIGTYLSHLTLFEHIVQRWPASGNASFLILQDDTLLKPGWLRQVGAETALLHPKWSRLLLVWWGLARQKDCRGHFCAVRPPAGPTEAGPECCGKRFYHGLQAWLVRRESLQCLIRRLRRRRIKNIDAQMVQCDCPRTFALQKRLMVGEHLDKELGSERAAVNSVWRAQLEGKLEGATADGSALRVSAQRNLRKTHLQHIVGEIGGRTSAASAPPASTKRTS